MNIQLKKWELDSLSFDREGKSPNKEFKMSIGHFLSDEKSNCFGIGFKINLKNENYAISAEIRFLFETDLPLTEEFKDSDFISINAPAIAFPYLRSFISNLTLQAGYPPLILPSVNFVKLAQHKLNQKS